MWLGQANALKRDLAYLANSTISVCFSLIDFTPRKAPRSSRLPALDQQHLVSGRIEEDGASNRNACLVCNELFVRCDGVASEDGVRGAGSYDSFTKLGECEGGQVASNGANEIFIEPVPTDREGNVESSDY